jgi:hypothetical protein
LCLVIPVPKMEVKGEPISETLDEQSEHAMTQRKQAEARAFVVGRWTRYQVVHTTEEAPHLPADEIPNSAMRTWFQRESVSTLMLSPVTRRLI